uniref:Small nuclear RNA activating complex polypeptide 4 n=1 Tax=Sphenodon punctatus TaxID=8508 RepID=A0A8D0HQL4_SPHPU
MSAQDLNAEREKIRREIEELEKSLNPNVATIDIVLSDSSLDSNSDEDDLEDDDSDIQGKEEEHGSDDDLGNSLPENPETCLQMNLVYQEVIQEKIEEVDILISQNREQQGPPANEDTRAKAAQGIKSFEDLIITKWKNREKNLLSRSVISDRLQRLLQPKLMKLDYLNQKLEKSQVEMEKQILVKQIKETERELENLNQLPEETLVGNRLDEHDWEKISNINFEGTRNPTEIRKFWQNCEHPSISKREWSEEEIEKLKTIAAEHNCLDWQTIAQKLGTNRSAFQCLQKFQAYNKDFKRKEWTKEEDQMLSYLVQEMRVGSHIPYRKMAYYMEARDSSQLLYRWTKSVDPNLKKGTWTPEEDALLLKAVDKYGACDWYKIRTEVPGRSDSQCRDRYLYALHNYLKKGKWSPEEVQNFIQLTEKHGVGCWAKIASELPHRSATQCLSKWKVVIGTKRKKHRPAKPLRKRQRRRAPSTSSSESSSEYSELELTDEPTGESSQREDDAVKVWTVPRIELWTPTSKNAAEVKKSRHLLPARSRSITAKEIARLASKVPVGEAEEQVVEESAQSNTALKGSGDSQPTAGGGEKDPADAANKASKTSMDGLRVSLDDVKRVLRRKTYIPPMRRRRRQRQAPVSASKIVSGPATSPLALQQPAARRDQRAKEVLQRDLDRRLLLAVIPWMDSSMLPCTADLGRAAGRRTKADEIQDRLWSVPFTSTPVFTLFIQLFQIDTNGCMKVIRERKSRQSELLRAVVGGTRRPLQTASNARKSTGQPARPCPPVVNAAAPKALVALQAQKGLAVISTGAPSRLPQAPVPFVPKPKPKTVSELLREKRLRESKATKDAQRTVILAPQMLVSPSVVIQPQVASDAQAKSELPGAGLPDKTSAKAQDAPKPLPTLASIVVSVPPSQMPAVGSAENTRPPLERKAKRKASAAENSGSGTDNGPSQGLRKAPAPNGGSSAPVQDQAFAPQRIMLVAPAQIPANGEAGAKEGSSALSLLGSQQRTITLVPSVAAPQSGPGAASNSVLPITWVVTPQGLVAVSVQTITEVSGQEKQPETGTGVGTSLNRGLAGKASQAKITLLTALPASAGSSRPPPSCAGPEERSLPLAEGAPSSSPTKEAPSNPPTVVKNRPIAPRPPSVQQTDSAPPLFAPFHEKNLLDFSLLSLEAVTAVREWLQGKEGVQIPLLERSFPYLPPFQCSLRTLSGLLLQREALEQSAARLVASEDRAEGEDAPASQGALRELVQQRLKDNPAFLLLKARFLAVFTLPAALATLPPPRATTTFSRGWRQDSDSEEESLLSSDKEGATAAELDGPAGTEPGRDHAALPDQVSGSQASPAASASDDGTDQASVLRPRRSSRLRKRRWQL